MTAAAAVLPPIAWCPTCREAALPESGRCSWCDTPLVAPATAGADVCARCSALIDWTRGDGGVCDDGQVFCSLCYAQTHLGFPFGPWSRKELLALYVLYVRGGRTLHELVDAGDSPLWQRKGYLNARAAESSITQAWRRNGWPKRRRGVSHHLRSEREGPRLQAHRKLSEADARALHPLHWEDWRSINSLAAEHAQRLGLTQSALCSQLSYTWKLLGLPRHERTEMVVHVTTRHGLKPKHGANSAAYKRFRAAEKGAQYDAPCDQLTARGRRCRARAMLGKTHCQQHDPERRQAIVAHLTLIRARSPHQRPENLTTVTEVQPFLQCYWTWAGTWKPLVVASGFSNAQLRRYLTAPPEQRILKTTARTIRRAVLELVPLDQRLAT